MSLYFTISINAIPHFRYHTYYIQSFIFSTLLYSAVIATCATSRMHYKESINVRYTRTYLHPQKTMGVPSSRDSHVSILEKGFPVPWCSFMQQVDPCRGRQ